MFGCGKGAGPGPSRELFMEASHSYGSYGQGYGALGISCPFVDVHWMTTRFTLQFVRRQRNG